MVWLDYMELHDDLVTISHQFPPTLPSQESMVYSLYCTNQVTPWWFCTAVVSSCGMKVHADCLSKQTMNHDTRSRFPKRHILDQWGTLVTNSLCSCYVHHGFTVEVLLLLKTNNFPAFCPKTKYKHFVLCQFGREQGHTFRKSTEDHLWKHSVTCPSCVRFWNYIGSFWTERLS